MAVANTKRIGSYSNSTHVVEEGSVELVGRVINHYRYTVRVSSDHAWIDSGNRVMVIYVDDDGMPRTQTYYTDDNGYVFENDATPEMVARATKMFRVVNHLKNLIHGYQSEERQNREVRQGDTVEVFKGWKAPKGLYEVVAMGNGDYGPYYNLRDKSGKWFSFINRDNCRKANVVPANVIEETKGEESFIRAMIARPNDIALVGAYADWLQQQGNTDGEYLSAWVVAGCPDLPSVYDLTRKASE